MATGLTRRTFLRTAGIGAAAFSAACTGFTTSGAGGMVFLSTQFRPADEAERFRSLLSRTASGVSYVTIEESPFASQVRSQVDAGDTKIGLLGGLHGDLAPLADGYLNDLTGLLADLGDRGWPADYLRLARSGTDRTWYIPWATASYVLAAHADALERLPSGVDANALTYDQFLDWAIAARRANGNRPMLGLPAGPKGLLHRFVQGFLLPSFTGGQITTFRSPEAVTAWQYFRELWANCASSSTGYDFMQDALDGGEVRMAWDHVVRLAQAPARDPGRWRMLPAPRGPHGLGYMAVVTGLAVPRHGPDPELAQRTISTLTEPDTQIELLRSNGFFPSIDTPVPGDLPPAVTMEADALRRQQRAPDALLSLPPVGLGKREGEVSKVFQDSFRSIVLGGADIRATLDQQARVLQGILDDLKVPCWAPDPAADRCEVG
ncbi:multiple sugar transport system substrate-binding protein [Nocardia transvalensis]|uniref:Multiple sugar transport system substrate-binding protein n=1 Tax=Nocardia transvalensis TaxID=37333 RepID=A0A7W9UGC3_9NOCA|nr:ABC transporter substrate-binding protein [Nocardia transvalensis]MBB5912124.1 multiple sugar transport system substrate-binding protein [Nocardia transvalensis]